MNASSVHPPMPVFASGVMLDPYTVPNGVSIARPPAYGAPDVGPQPILYHVTVKATERGDEYEMYNVSDDPMELSNLYDDGIHAATQALLAQLLEQQRCAKRLVPVSGEVPGQPIC